MPANVDEVDDDQNEEGDTYDMVFPYKYHNDTPENTRVVQENVGQDGKVVKYYQNEKKEILFVKGVRKVIFPDGYTVVYFTNKDIKQTYPDGKVVYFYSETDTTQTTLPDGLNIYKF